MSVAILNNYRNYDFKNSVSKSIDNKDTVWERIAVFKRWQDIIRNKDIKILMHENIINDKDIRNNEPILKGTRITVYEIVKAVCENYIDKDGKINFESIRNDYPSIQNKEQIELAFFYLFDKKMNNTLGMLRFIFS